MPQRIITIWTCSLCPEETENGEKIKHYSLSEGKRSIVLDVCTNCEMTEPFATIISAGLSDKIGARTSKAAYDDLVRCEFCDGEYTVRGMGMHRAKVHNVKSKTTITNEKRGKSGKFVCECGFRSAAAQGLAAHRQHKHPTPIVKHGCPDCPEFVGNNAQHLGAHRRHVHPGAPKLGHGKK